MGTDSPQEPPEGAQPCQCLAFGRWNPFWTSEQLVCICYSSNRRLTQQPWKEGMVTGPTVQTQRSVITGPRGWVAGDGTWAQCPRAGALFALSADPPARPGQCWGCPWSVFCWLAGVPPPFTSVLHIPSYTSLRSRYDVAGRHSVQASVVFMCPAVCRGSRAR